MGLLQQAGGASGALKSYSCYLTDGRTDYTISHHMSREHFTNGPDGTEKEEVTTETSASDLKLNTDREPPGPSRLDLHTTNSSIVVSKPGENIVIAYD